MSDLLPRMIRYLGLSMSFMYLGLGVFFLFFFDSESVMSKTYRIAFAIMLLVYGAFRMYRHFYPTTVNDDEN